MLKKTYFLYELIQASDSHFYIEFAKLGDPNLLLEDRLVLFKILD